MPKIPENELRFQLLRGLQQLSRSTLKDLASSSDKRNQALEVATDTLMARMQGKKVYRPDPLANHGS